MRSPADMDIAQLTDVLLRNGSTMPYVGSVESHRPHSDACLAGHCSSYIHCHLLPPGAIRFYDGPNSRPTPVCNQQMVQLAEIRDELARRQHAQS